MYIDISIYTLIIDKNVESLLIVMNHVPILGSNAVCGSIYRLDLLNSEINMCSDYFDGFDTCSILKKKCMSYNFELNTTWINFEKIG